MRVQSPDTNFLGIPEVNSSYDTALFAVLPAPYEHSVSYGRGTGAAPDAILEASHYVEFWDEEFRRELCFQHGIATLEPVRFDGAVDEAAMAVLHAHAASVIRDGKILVTLGGEHSITAPLVRAHLDAFPDLSVLHFDAHSDLRTEYLGNPWSHASAMARVLDFLPPARLTQLGIRAQCIEEYERIQESGIRTHFAGEMRDAMQRMNPAGDAHTSFLRWNFADEIAAGLTDDVYVTFDVDFLDPSIMPTTGTPEPGGFLWDETLRILRTIGSTKRIVGFDVVELAPDPALAAPTYLTAKLVYKMMNAAVGSR